MPGSLEPSQARICPECQQALMHGLPCHACHASRYGTGLEHEAMALFVPAPAVMPGQLGLEVPDAD